MKAAVPCAHAHGTMWGLCVRCGAHQPEAGGDERRRTALVLDLDHTLVHAAAAAGPTDGETSGWAPSAAHRRESHVSRIRVNDTDLLISVRPGVRELLRHASGAGSFSLHIYTWGSAEYARAVRELLDPRGEIFASVAARGEGGAGPIPLKDVTSIGVDPATAIIVDDAPHVWVPGQRGRVLQVRPYVFFGEEEGAARRDEDREMQRVMLRILTIA